MSGCLTFRTVELGSANAIGTSGTITFGGGTLQFSASNTTDYSARFSNVNSQSYRIDTSGQNVTLASNLTSSGGTFTKLGAGRLTLSGSNTYTGTTTVSTGTLEVSGASGALTATSAVNITGGALLLSGSASNRINNAATISLGAATDSTLQLSGAVIETLGALTLASGAGIRVIDFGTTSGVLTLASLTAASNLPLQIWNWSGTTGAGGGTDQLSISSGFLGGALEASNVSFFSGSGTGLYSETTTFTSGGELVPGGSVAVPEPGTLLPAAALVMGAFLRRRRSRSSRSGRAAA
jgi:autotransporter-associated beta strand protein